jgi:hypothetical protein
MIEGKSPEQIRQTFNLPDDLTEEEKLEPIKACLDDPRIRLLNRLYARKRKVSWECRGLLQCHSSFKVCRKYSKHECIIPGAAVAAAGFPGTSTLVTMMVQLLRTSST